MYQHVSKKNQQQRRLHTPRVAQTPRFMHRAGQSMRPRHQTMSNHGLLRRLAAEGIQPKLKIGAPNDRYEQEADRVAEQVMRMSESEAMRDTDVMSSIELPQIQRLRSECEEELQRQLLDEEEEEELVQAKERAGQVPEVTPGLQSQINNLRGGGQPLPESARNFFEPRFGTDFGKVRIHIDSSAVQMSQNIRAQAFTHGRDVYFNSGKYNPDTPSGKSLLAHELTHIVQQGGRNSIPSTQTKPSASHNSVNQTNSRDKRGTPPTSNIQRNPNKTVQRKVKVNAGLDLNMHGYTHTKSGDVYTAPRIAKNSVFHEIFTSLLNSLRTFKIKGSTNAEVDKNFSKHRSARQGVVEFAAKKKYTFGAGSAFRMNPKYWNVTSTSWSLKPGVNRTEAINDLNKNPVKYNIACLAATELTMEGGGKSPTQNKGSANLSDWVPGDWGYITNNSFTGLSADVGLEGENIIYMGKDKFWGHFGPGNTFKTLDDWKKTVEGWNGSATIENQRTFPNAGLE